MTSPEIARAGVSHGSGHALAWPVVTDPEPSPDHDPRPRYGTPATPRRWVRVLVILAAVALLVAIVVLHLTGTLGGGTHQ